MNLLGKKHDGQFTRWKPFATSTPLKPISVNPKCKNGSCPVRPTLLVPSVTQKMPVNLKSVQNKASPSSKIKITGKNRSRAYFDLSSSSSSSSDDDARPVENRPIIKISTENTDMVKVVAENGKCSVGEKVAKSRSSIRRKVDNSKCQTGKCESQEGEENKAKNRSVSLNSDLENLDLSHDNEINLPATVNNISSENNGSLYVTLEFHQRSKQEVKQLNKVTVKKPALEVNNEKCKHVKNIQMLKHKGMENRNAVYDKKKKRDMQAVVTDKPKMASEIWANSSHQLFTDSIQEELINTLHLTTPEADEFITNVDFSKVSQKSIIKLKRNRGAEPELSKKYEMVKEMEGSMKIPQRPKRTRKAPKNYWLVDVKPKCTRTSRRKLAMQCENIGPPNKQLRGTAWNIVTRKNLNIDQTMHKSQQISAGQNGATNNCQNKGFKKYESLYETKEPSFLRTKKDKGPLLGTKLENTSKHPVFIPLNEISYNENEFGHQVSQICSLKNFKCGIFKIKPGSNFTWKSQGSTYMGGILIKGEMKMTTGSKGRVLQEGDMVFLPPLSEYQASNSSKCDLNFYYWTFNN